MKHTVLLIDDHEIVRKAISNIVNNYPNFEVIGDVNGFDELEIFLKKNEIPELLLLDIVMPGKNGFEVAEWMKENYAQVKMLSLSSEAEPETIAKIIRKGAMGYIHKSAGPAELLVAMETVMSGNNYLAQKDLNAMTQALQNDKYFALEKLFLSAKEKEYLKHLCTALSYKEIANEMGVSVRSLDDIKEGLSSKIGVNTRQELVMFAAKNGLA